jgi:hypothetical protein
LILIKEIESYMQIEAVLHPAEARRIAANIAKLPELLQGNLVSVRQVARQVNRVLVAVAASIAGPQVPNTMIRQMLRPFRCNDLRLTLYTLGD